MPNDTNDPWQALPAEEALRRIRHVICPGWKAWIVPLWDGGIVWCARRLGDGALAHGDHPGRLLEHIADADDKLTRDGQGWP